MTNCEVINAFGTSNLDVKSFDMLSLASRLAAATINRANTLRLAYSFYSLNRSLLDFLDESHAIIQGKEKPPASGAAPEPTTPERMRITADNMENVHRMIEYIYELGKRARLTNNSLTAGSLESLRRNGEELLDFADWLELMADPNQHKSVFERAEQEKESGEMYDLTQVK